MMAFKLLAACGSAVLASAAFAGCGHGRPSTAAMPQTPAGSRAPSRTLLLRPVVLGLTAEQATLTRLMALRVPIHCGGHKGRDVALTFDDGPGRYTSLALRLLRHAHARATFFVVGKELGWWPHLPRQELVFDALGDHTWTHSYLPRMNRLDIRRELASTQAEIWRLTRTTVRFFRPPYGASNARISAVARSLGMLEVLWSIDSRDSEGAGWREIARRIAHSVRPGSIILLHENHGQTIRALKFRILPLLHARRLIPVTLRTLLLTDPPSTAQVRAGLRAC